jgi:hypothetical protein
MKFFVGPEPAKPCFVEKTINLHKYFYWTKYNMMHQMQDM